MFASHRLRHPLNANALLRRLSKQAAEKYDYVIVGAGSAGCVLANRLSSDPSKKVLLIEAGRENRWLSLHMPAMCLDNLNSTWYNWKYQGAPEPGLGGRSIKHDRGKTIGGSSSINGMVYIRGHPLDFDGWRQSGCKGWGYADVLPYFKRLESYSGGGDEYRGDSGPLHVERPDTEALTKPLNVAFMKAAEEAGYPISDDLNGYCQEGFGPFEKSIHLGLRESTARSYLKPARQRSNLTVVTRALVERVMTSEQTATGVVYKDKRGQEVTALADQEVILSAGAVGTPHLLMLSGIGAKSELEEHGIEVVADLPGVGANLDDHPDFVMKYRCLQPVTLYEHSKPLACVAAGIEWLLTQKGVCASNHFDVAGCIRSGPGVQYPDLQFTISPIAMEGHSFVPMQEHAFQVHVGLMQTNSKGKISLQNADPATPPQILVNYFQDERDREVMRKGIRLMRELLDQPAFAPYKGEEVFPGKDVVSDEDLDRNLLESTASQWHLTGTARMGSVEDPSTVVDTNGKVHGIEKLRVVDASIMPRVTNANTNSPTIMLAEKLSDAILSIPPLESLPNEFWQHPEYATQQR